jgi:hypothetical protein
VRTNVFFIVWFQKGAALLSVAIMRQRSMVTSEADNFMKAETRGLVTVVQVFAAVRNWLGDSGFTAVVCKRG